MLESPKAENVSYGRILRNLSYEIDKQTNIVFDFPVEEIGKLFYKVDATFHTVFLRTTIGVESRDHETMKIASDMEKCIGEVTRASGGTLVAASNVKSAVKQIVEAENILYLLTYAPKNPSKAGRLKIKAGKKKYNVLYDDNMRADYLNEYAGVKTGAQDQGPEICIKELYLKDKKLCLSIENVFLNQAGKEKEGRIEVHVFIMDLFKAFFDQTKLLTTKKDTVSISIPLANVLKNGRSPEISVTVKDLYSGKKDRKSILSNYDELNI